jgi:hypothetical protein
MSRRKNYLDYTKRSKTAQEKRKYDIIPKEKHLICSYLDVQGLMARRILDNCNFSDGEVERCLNRKNYLEAVGKCEVRAHLMTEI